MITEVSIGDRFKYTPQIPHNSDEEFTICVISKYHSTKTDDIRYKVLIEDTGETRKGYLLSNFQCSAIERLNNPTSKEEVR